MMAVQDYTSIITKITFHLYSRISTQLAGHLGNEGKWALFGGDRYAEVTVYSDTISLQHFFSKNAYFSHNYLARSKYISKI